MLPGYQFLLTHLVLLAHSHQFDLDGRLYHTHFNAFLVLAGSLQLVGADAEVLLQLVVERVEVGLREEDVAGVLGLADGAQATHRGLQHKYLGLRLAEQSNPEQRAAVPTFPALVDQQNELFLRACGVELVELADIVVGGQLFLADVDQDARGRDVVLEQRALYGRFQLAGQLVDRGCEEG